VIIITIFFFFQAEDGIRDFHVTGVQTCALPICPISSPTSPASPAPAPGPSALRTQQAPRAAARAHDPGMMSTAHPPRRTSGGRRSEERRVGKEWRSGGSPHDEGRKKS